MNLGPGLLEPFLSQVWMTVNRWGRTKGLGSWAPDVDSGGRTLRLLRPTLRCQYLCALEVTFKSSIALSSFSKPNVARTVKYGSTGTLYLDCPKNNVVAKK